MTTYRHRKNKLRVQACRPEDRAMLETPAGAELVTAAAAALDNNTPRPLSSDYPPTVEDLREAGLWPFPKTP